MNGRKRKVYYSDLFWLFMMGSLLGVLLEGVFCIFRYGHWETHTVTVWGPFCIVYGIGAVTLYRISVWLNGENKIIQFLAYAVIATIVEYLCGALIKYGLHMIAWDYSAKFLNIDGIVCPSFTISWGIAGLVFSKWCVPPLQVLFAKTHGTIWNAACVCLSVFMSINLLLTAACITRWAQRHYGILAHNHFEQFIDKTWNDTRMEKRFCEWRFVD